MDDQLKSRIDEDTTIGIVPHQELPTDKKFFQAFGKF